MGSTTSSRLSLQVISEKDLNYDDMTKAPPTTMQIVKEANAPDGAFTTNALPWPQYILDAWYTPALAPLMVASPRGKVLLLATDIQCLKSNPSPESKEFLDLASRVQENFPLSASHDANEPFQCFVRLSMCSTKRGAHAYPAHNGTDVVQQIVDSQRCVQSLSCPVEHTIWLFEWNQACDITREFRVFIQKGKIVALAPYYCAVPLEWLTPKNATQVGLAILEWYEHNLKDYLLNYFQDAVMDVLYTDQKAIQLIEFNPIVTSGGGLFSWVHDKDLLNGVDVGASAVMRIVEPWCG